jgi:hypothetical protein
MLKRLLGKLCLIFLLLPTLSLAAVDLLLNEDDVATKIVKDPDYQLLDARSADAQRLAPLAYSTKYQKTMYVKKGLVLIVADTDAAALEIAQSIPAVERSVYAIKGGAEAWKRALAKEESPSAMPHSFVIPKNTCEPGKPVMTLKGNQALKHPQEK